MGKRNWDFPAAILIDCVTCGSIMTIGNWRGKTFFLCINHPKCGGKLLADRNKLKLGQFSPAGIAADDEGRKLRYDLHKMSHRFWGKDSGRKLQALLNDKFPHSGGHAGEMLNDDLKEAFKALQEKVNSPA